MEQQKKKYIPGILLAGILASCSSPSPKLNHEQSKDKQKITKQQMEATITIKATLTPLGAVGYGNTYSCVVEEVIEGRLDADKMIIVVMASDERGAFVESHLSPASVRISFLKDEENVPKKLMPITGFVDDHYTSWKVISIQ